MTNDASGFIFDDLEVAQSSESLGDITAPSQGGVFIGHLALYLSEGVNGIKYPLNG